MSEGRQELLTGCLLGFSLSSISWQGSASRSIPSHKSSGTGARFQKEIGHYCRVASRCLSVHEVASDWELLDLCNPEVQCRIHMRSPKISILSRINPIPRTDACFFKDHSKIVLPSTSKSKSSYRSLPCRLTCYNSDRIRNFFYSGYMAIRLLHVNLVKS